MIPEIAALKLELDPHTLPLASIDLSLGLAIWISGLDRFDVVAQLAGNHTEKKDDALLVYGLVTKPPKINRIAVGRPVVEATVAMVG